MAERRMFTMKIVDSDAFLDMPMSSQALYFHLNMRADDDGFVNSPKKIMRMIGASEDDLKLLIAKRFILCFENGVIVIKHWRMHNLLRKDRYNPTQYIEQKAMLTIKDDGAYTEKPSGNQVATTWQPSGNQVATQDRVGKDRKGKDSIGEGREKQDNQTPAPLCEFGRYKNVYLSETDLETLKKEFPEDWSDRIERLSSYMARSGKTYHNHLATIIHWADEDKKSDKQNGSFDTDSFFDAAVNRAYQEMPKTAADDDNIKERGEELRKRLAQ